MNSPDLPASGAQRPDADQAAADQAAAVGRAILDRAILDRAILDRAVLDQAVDQAVLDQAVLDQAVLDQAVLDRTVLGDADTRRRLARRRHVRDALISATATMVVVGLFAWLITSAEGWPDVRERFFEQRPAREGRDAQDAWSTVLAGLGLSVTIFCVAEVFILLLGLAVAVVRSLPGPALFPFRALAVIFTDVFRGVPTLLVIFLLGFGIPALRFDGVPNNPVLWGTVALVLVGAAFNAEIFRAGIDSIHPSQMAAARSLGLSRLQALRFVIVPQAVQRMIAPLLSSFVSLQKETVLISILGPQELMRRAQNDAGRYFNYTPYVIAALIFLAMTVPLARLTDWLIRRQLRAQWGTK